MSDIKQRNIENLAMTVAEAATRGEINETARIKDAQGGPAWFDFVVDNSLTADNSTIYTGRGTDGYWVKQATETETIFMVYDATKDADADGITFTKDGSGDIDTVTTTGTVINIHVAWSRGTEAPEVNGTAITDGQRTSAPFDPVQTAVVPVPHADVTADTFDVTYNGATKAVAFTISALHTATATIDETVFPVLSWDGASRQTALREGQTFSLEVTPNEAIDMIRFSADSELTGLIAEQSFVVGAGATGQITLTYAGGLTDGDHNLVFSVRSSITGAWSLDTSASADITINNTAPTFTSSVLSYTTGNTAMGPSETATYTVTGTAEMITLTDAGANNVTVGNIVNGANVATVDVTTNAAVVVYAELFPVTCTLRNPSNGLEVIPTLTPVLHSSSMPTLTLLNTPVTVRSGPVPVAPLTIKTDTPCRASTGLDAVGGTITNIEFGAPSAVTGENKLTANVAYPVTTTPGTSAVTVSSLTSISGVVANNLTATDSITVSGINPTPVNLGVNIRTATFDFNTGGDLTGITAVWQIDGEERPLTGFADVTGQPATGTMRVTSVNGGTQLQVDIIENFISISESVLVIQKAS